jgi:hypothetical protein
VRWRDARLEMRTRCTVISVSWSWSSRLSRASSNGFFRDLHDMKGAREKHGPSLGFAWRWFLGACRRWRCWRLSPIFALHFFLESCASAFGVSYHRYPFYSLLQ